MKAYRPTEPPEQVSKTVYDAAADRSHHCPECGYDLRVRASGRCPECGYGYDHSSVNALAKIYTENQIDSFRSLTVRSAFALACFVAYSTAIPPRLWLLLLALALSGLMIWRYLNRDPLGTPLTASLILVVPVGLIVIGTVFALVFLVLGCVAVGLAAYSAWTRTKAPPYAEYSASEVERRTLVRYRWAGRVTFALALAAAAWCLV